MASKINYNDMVEMEEVTLKTMRRDEKPGFRLWRFAQKVGQHPLEKLEEFNETLSKIYKHENK